MAESLLPEVIPGLVQVERTGGDDKNTGEKKGARKNVFPIDAKELLMTGDYKLVENGAVEAARMNANPLRALGLNPNVTVAEVTGIAGQAHMAQTEEEAQKLIKAADHGGKEAPAEQLPDGSEVAREAPKAEPAKAPGTPVNAKGDDRK
jgi:hypothetical protein